MPAGGLNKVDFFRVKIVSGAYVAKQLDGTAAATSAAHASIRLNKNSKIDHGRKGKTYGLTFEQTKADAELEALIEAILLAPVASGGSVVVGLETYVDGSTEFGDASSASGELLLGIGYSYSKAGEVFIYGTLGTLSDDTGSFAEVANAAAKPKFTLAGSKAEYDFDIKALIDTALVTAPTTFTIAEGRGYVTAYAAVV